MTKYRTVYYGTLTDSFSGIICIGNCDKVVTFDNAVARNKEYTRQGKRPEYKFTIINLDETKDYYYDIDLWDIKQKQIPYTETVSISEQLIDKYETRYKTEYIKVRRPLILWILGLE